MTARHVFVAPRRHWTGLVRFALASALGIAAFAAATPAFANIFNDPSWSKSFLSAGAPGSTVTLQFTIDHTATPSTGFDIGNASFTDDLDATLSGLVNASGPQTGFCGAGSSLTGTSIISVTGIDVPAETTCTFSIQVSIPGSATPGSYTNTTSSLGGEVAGTTGPSLFTVDPVSDDLEIVDAPSATAPMILDFLERRGTILLAHEPDRQRRIQRLTDPANGGDPRPVYDPTVTASIGDPGAPPPGSKEAIGLAYARELAGLSEDPVMSPAGGTPEAWDIWTDGTLGGYQQGDIEGWYGIGYVGADKLVGDGALIGGLIQIDRFSETDIGTDAAQTATGWAIGPYATFRLGDGLFLDTRATYGHSANTISPLGTYTDDYDTTDWLVSAALQGEIPDGNFVFAPEARLGYYHQTQHSYTDSTATVIPEQTVDLLQAGLGAGIRVRQPSATGDTEFRAKAELIADYTSLNGGAATRDAYGRIEIGADRLTEDGKRLEIEGAYEHGFAGNELRALSVRAKVAVDFDQ
nr:autotransporter outer membrane beta-barrel domain-containing protein [Cucumibacter marinus]